MQQFLELGPDVLVGGRYRLTESIASGGTASVWRAMDEHQHREVAIKLLRDEGVDDGLRTRARREAKVLEDLDHPNLVRVLESGEEEGRPFMVMELLDGEPLHVILRRRGKIPVDEAVGLVVDVARGLGAAHAHGVIHRDVKPANIVCHERVPVLVDFGIARAIDATTLTRGLVVGTASYLAPEQAQGLPLTPACDVYALTCVLYELLTGRPPFQGDSPITVATKHVHDEPEQPCDLADVPAAVNAVIMRALAKDPSGRPADGGALADELEAALAQDGDETVSLAPVAPPVDGTMVMPVVSTDGDLIDPSPLPPVPPPPARRAAGPWVPILVVVALVTGAILLAGALGGDGLDMRPVPDVTNASVEDATTYLEGAGLEVDVEQVASEAPAGTVVASDPRPGEPIDEGGTVTLAVSSGPAAPASTTTAPPPDDGDDDGDGAKPGKGKGRDGDD